MNLRRLVFPLFLFMLFCTMTSLPYAAALAQSQQDDQQRPRMMCPDRFKAMDTDKDGVVTKDEFMAGPHRGIGKPIEDAFTSTDADANGKLTVEEFCAGRGPGPGRGMGKPNSQQ